MSERSERTIDTGLPSGARRERGDGLLGGIVRLNLAVTQVLDRITGEAGITLADYLVLGVVRGAPGHRSAPTAICEVLGRTTGGMSLTLDRLEDSGWLRRSADPDDRRRVVVELTRAGLELATRVNAALHEWEATLDLPREHRETLAVIDGIAGAIQDRVTTAAAAAPAAEALSRRVLPGG